MKEFRHGVVACLLVAVLAAAAPAEAQGRPDIRSMSCQQAQSLVQENGAVVLTTGRHTYDRYVAGQQFCFPGYVTRRAHVGTNDSAMCLIGYTCVPDTDWHDDRWWQRR
ncbi:hypothetical protein [Nitratireductor sp. GCM10026969]|uniref:hypothetical protein n=1 Tax=Nitratireductor sp. GCM10026969 TaxID=3252645 RepID=UPI00360E0AAE